MNGSSASAKPYADPASGLFSPSPPDAVPALRANAQPSDTSDSSDEGCASQPPTVTNPEGTSDERSFSQTSMLFREAFWQLSAPHTAVVSPPPLQRATTQLPDKNKNLTVPVPATTAELSGAEHTDSIPQPSLQQLSLTAADPGCPLTSASPSPATPAVHHMRPRADPFSSFRTPSLLAARPSSSSGPSNESVPGPSKRARQMPSYLAAVRPGIQPHPARSPRWGSTPANYTNVYANLHPWGIYVEPRPRLSNLSEEVITPDLPTHVYRFIPQDGYFASRFVRSLFPRRFVGTPAPDNKISIMELQRLDDIIAFRQHAIRLTEDLLDDVFENDFAEFLRLPRTAPGANVTCLYPPTRGGVLPVLYQVVSRSYGTGVVLEAKDFFTPGPDHRELQCLPLTQDSVNLLSRTRGFDRNQLSIKDFIWVYSLRPTARTLESGNRYAILREARRPRPTIVDSAAPYFLRVHEFIPVTPSSERRNILGLVIAVTRRGANLEYVNNFYAAFEGSQEAIRVPPTICDFPIDDVERDMLLLASCRRNVSCAMRFCHSAVSLDSQRILVNAARRFLPAHPEEGLLPLQVSRMLPADLRWIADRERDFVSYSRDRRSSRHRMSQLFAVASAALAAYNVWSDDKSTHEVTAFVPSLDALPIRMMVDIDAASAQCGWARSRTVHTWIVHSSMVFGNRIAATTFMPDRQMLEVELHSEPHRHRGLLRAIQQFGRVRGEANGAVVRMCVRLARAPTGTDPVFSLLADDTFSSAIGDPDTPSRANTVLDLVYSSRPRPEREHPLPTVSLITITLNNINIPLRNDQSNAVHMGLGNHPILAIQAAFGTGKTVVGAYIAARLAEQGRLVIATATTNVAVAQFTDTLLELNEFRRLKVLRFLADSALREGAPTTPVDLHQVLRGLVANLPDKLSEPENEKLTNYARGRALIERLLLDPEATLHLSDEEREQYRIAERYNSEDTEEAVRIMLRVRFPNIVCMTTASLLSTTRAGGLFSTVFHSADVVIGDEASQIPEPAFVALVARFTSARHIYIGDANQLEPHVRCPRSSMAARLGGKGLMSLLMQKDVPVAPLVTTFRAHPALNGLPNRLVYNGSLVSGSTARQRQLLTRRLSLPNPDIPFVLVDVRGHSHASSSQSHYNRAEASCCEDLVCALLAKDILASSIAVITFYKEQQRRLEEPLRRLGVPLHTVDSVQGREMDIVIVLTTRTNLDGKSGEFVDDIRRLNVAITRCRHGQFILGHAEALQQLPNWGRVLQWAHERNAIVGTTSLPDIFA